MHRRILLLGFLGLALLLAPGLARAQSSGEAPGDASAVATPQAPPPAGQRERYVGPFYTSQTALPGSRSVSVITVHNEAGITCNVGVQFQFVVGTTNICSLTQAIPAKQTRTFCTRSVNDPLVPCTMTCAPELTFNTGHFFVSSTKPAPTAVSDPCKKINVDARLYFTRDAADDLLEGATRLTVVRSPQANIGD